MKQEKKVLYVGALIILAIGLLMAGVSPLYLFVLACPVSMMFMMHGMGHGSTNHDSTNHSEHVAKDPNRER
jgi:hypothetical protein